MVSTSLLVAAVLVLDVQSGKVLHSADAEKRVLPLSVVKLYVAAVWWDRGLGGSLDDMLVDGRDQPGRERAIELRKRFGGAAVLADLRRYGLVLDLSPDAADATWADTLSLGEAHIGMTLKRISDFLRKIALSKSETSRKLRAAMINCVRRGTARKAPPAAKGFLLGGKTGTGPATASPHDGIFAGLVFEDGEPRSTVAVYVERGGPGGGKAAAIAAGYAR